MRSALLPTKMLAILTVLYSVATLGVVLPFVVHLPAVLTVPLVLCWFAVAVVADVQVFTHVGDDLISLGGRVKPFEWRSEFLGVSFAILLFFVQLLLWPLFMPWVFFPSGTVLRVRQSTRLARLMSQNGETVEKSSEICTSCREKLALGAKFCGGCGHAVHPVQVVDLLVCQNCGTINPYASICYECGQALGIGTLVVHGAKVTKRD